MGTWRAMHVIISIGGETRSVLIIRCGSDATRWDGNEGRVLVGKEGRDACAV